MIRWSVWTEATTEPKARRVLQRLLRRLPAEPQGLTVAPYPKTSGHVLSFSTATAAERWADLVLETLTLGQTVGYTWYLTGEAARSLSGWSNASPEAGVVSVSWDVERGDLP